MSWDSEEGNSVLQNQDFPHCSLHAATLPLVTGRLAPQLLQSPTLTHDVAWEAMLGTFWQRLSDICSHGQNNDEAPFSSLSTLAGLENALCEAWLSHRRTQGLDCPPPVFPTRMPKAFAYGDSSARLFTKAKERHFFLFRARWLGRLEFVAFSRTAWD